MKKKSIYQPIRDPDGYQPPEPPPQPERTPEEWDRLNHLRIKASIAALEDRIPVRAWELLAAGSFDEGSLCYQDAVAGPHELLVLSGGPGAGKTVAACRLLFDAIADKKNWRVFGDRPEMYDRAALKFLFLTAARLSRMSRYDDESMDEVMEAKTLVIDDLGAEYSDSKGAFASLLDEIVNERYSNRLRTIMTTNLHAQGFKERYGERIIDRIREAGAFIATDEVSRRRQAT